MRPATRLWPVIAILFVCCAVSRVAAQDAQAQWHWLRASNCNCTIGTFSNASAIEWFGSCNNGYGDGYGTVNYYDPNGTYSGKYVGSVTQGRLNGWGTKYYADGSIVYQGWVKDNEFTNVKPYQLLNDAVGNFIIDSLLSGGINRSCYIVKSIFSRDGEPQEIRWRVDCDGQVVNTNHYTCTLVLSNQSPYVNIVNANDNAQVFITLNLLRYTQQLADWFQRQEQQNRQGQ
jgi:hypothetical protein